MLNQWFAQKSTVLRPPVLSNARPSPVLTPAPHSSSPHPAHSTPHDAIIASLFADPDSQRIDPTSSKPGLEDDDYVNRGHGGLFDKPRTAERDQQHNNIFSEVLYDPADGSVVGQLSSPDPNLYSDSRTHNEEMWSNLYRVLELQSDIARLHVDMEGIRVAEGKGKSMGPTSTHSVARSVGDIGIGKVSPGIPSVERGENKDVKDDKIKQEEEEEEEEEGVGVEDEEAENLRVREEEFAKLADQFDAKKEAIGAIMDKLEDLSKVLTEFHALQVPNLDFHGARTNSFSTPFPIPSIAINSSSTSYHSPPISSAHGSYRETQTKSQLLPPFSRLPSQFDVKSLSPSLIPSLLPTPRHETTPRTYDPSPASSNLLDVASYPDVSTVSLPVKSVPNTPANLLPLNTSAATHPDTSTPILQQSLSRAPPRPSSLILHPETHGIVDSPVSTNGSLAPE